ncbi:hypothetical protein JTY60_01575 [symbiont of Argiope bruennichi]|uniref:hypothetical protein n=1 Tax=symbiont of Argiope bruennichi TaxID=2810479 RepID=UPI003DA54C1B
MKNGFLDKLYSDPKYFPFWNFKNFSLKDLKKEFTFDDKDSFKNCKIALNYLFPLDASKEEPKGNVVIEGYFLVPNDNKKSKNDDVEKNYYIPVNFVFTNKEDLSVIEINNDFPDIFSEKLPPTIFFIEKILMIFFLKILKTTIFQRIRIISLIIIIFLRLIWKLLTK